MPAPSLTQSEAQEGKRPSRAVTHTNLTNLTNPIKKTSLNILSSRLDADNDQESPFPSRPESEEDSMIQDASAPPSQLGDQHPRNHGDPRGFSAMAVDGSAPPSQNQLMQNYGTKGKEIERAKVDTEDWTHHAIKDKDKDKERVKERNKERKEMGSVIEEDSVDEGTKQMKEEFGDAKVVEGGQMMNTEQGAKAGKSAA